jgi:hypothetical protein
MKLLLLTITQISMSLLRARISGTEGVEFGTELIRIIAAAEEAYEKHEGEPLDWKNLPRRKRVEP